MQTFAGNYDASIWIQYFRAGSSTLSTLNTPREKKYGTLTLLTRLLTALLLKYAIWMVEIMTQYANTKLSWIKSYQIHYAIAKIQDIAPALPCLSAASETGPKRPPEGADGSPMLFSYFYLRPPVPGRVLRGREASGERSRVTVPPFHARTMGASCARVHAYYENCSRLPFAARSPLRRPGRIGRPSARTVHWALPPCSPLLVRRLGDRPRAQTNRLGSCSVALIKRSYIQSNIIIFIKILDFLNNIKKCFGIIIINLIQILTLGSPEMTSQLRLLCCRQLGQGSRLGRDKLHWPGWYWSEWYSPSSRRHWMAHAGTQNYWSPCRYTFQIVHLQFQV